MRRRPKIPVILFSLLLVLGIFPIVYFATVEMGIAQASGKPPKQVEKSNALDRQIDNVAFGLHEKLYFDVNYGFINAGTATMEVSRLIEYRGRPCYQVVTTAQSNRFFSTFYEVKDRVESIVDAVGIFSWRFEKDLHEGSYRANRISEFDQMNQLAYHAEDTVEVPFYVQDALSVLYYVRTRKLEVGQSLFVDNFTDGKLYPLEVKVLERETISVKAGTFDCIVVEPLLKSVGIFKHEGQLKVWLTDDRLKMPVLMKSKVLVGSISAELTDYELGDIDVF